MAHSAYWPRASANINILIPIKKGNVAIPLFGILSLLIKPLPG